MSEMITLTKEQLANEVRWGREYGIRQERERIINLLQADCKDGLGDQIQGCSHEVAIALIKGENK